jgi:IclR family acetate operon transcriptional repressor
VRDRKGGSRVPPLSDALQEAPGSLGTVRNAVLLLELLADGPAYQQLTELADQSGLSLPTVHRLLRSLVLADLVEQDPRSSRYGLGPALTRLSHRYLARLPVLGALAPYLSEVRDAVGGTVNVQILVGPSVVYVDRVDGVDIGPYRHPYGLRPALLTAGGRLLAARADDVRWQLAVDEVDEETRAQAERERGDWAQARWLVSDGTLGAAAEVAVPVVDASWGSAAALSADLPRGVDSDRLRVVVDHLTRAAGAAVRTLGHG